MHTFRTRLTPGDPSRDWTVFWSRAGAPAGDGSLLSPGGKPIPLPAEPAPSRSGANLAPYVRTVRVPAGTDPGTYAVRFGTETVGTVQVISPAGPKKRTTLPAGAAVDDVEKALAKGTVALAAGVYEWDRAFHQPAGSTLIAYGAHVFRSADGDYGERMLMPGDDCTILGGTFYPLWMVFGAYPAARGVVVRDCTFRPGATGRGVFGWGLAGALVADCLFDGVGCLYPPVECLYLRCRWRDNPPGDLAFYTMPQSPIAGTLAMIDSEFDRTDRGPSFNLMYGGLSDCLFAGTTCRGIRRDDNGNEILMAEGGGGAFGFDRNLVLHTRVSDSDSSVFQMWDVAARDNLVADTVQDGGMGFLLAGLNGAVQTGNVFENFELRDCLGFTFGFRDGNGVHGSGIANNAVRNGAILGYRASRGGQGYYYPTAYDRDAAILALPGVGPGNRAENVSYVDLPRGVVGARGLEEVNCRVVRGAGAA